MAWNWGTCEESWYGSCPAWGSFWDHGTGAIELTSCLNSYLKTSGDYDGTDQNSTVGMYDYWLKYIYLQPYLYNPLGGTFAPTEANDGCTIQELQYLNLFLIGSLSIKFILIFANIFFTSDDSFEFG